MNLLSARRIGDETDNRENQEDEEQDLRDSGRACGDAGKAEHGCDERDDEKDNCVMKHRYLRSVVVDGTPFSGAGEAHLGRVSVEGMQAGGRTARRSEPTLLSAARITRVGHGAVPEVS